MLHRTRSVVVASVILVFGFSSFAIARSGDPLREGVRNGTTTKETEIISNIKAGSGTKGGYATRQSNKSDSGGGAIYGCRATEGGTAKGKAPCIRANNLSSGLAFEFNATSGPLGGLITVGNGGDTKKPFTTNATGVADGLNADRVDGQNAADIVAAARAKANLDADTVDGASASQLRTRWALVDETGAIVEQSGGFSVTTAYGQPVAPANNPNVYIDAGESLTDNGLNVSVAAQNRVSRDGDAAPEPNFGGSVSIARCGEGANATTCAPAGTNNANHLVVAPRVPTAPAGGGAITYENTTAETRQRFYVFVTE
jgi:hypothetical protein